MEGVTYYVVAEVSPSYNGGHDAFYVVSPVFPEEGPARVWFQREVAFQRTANLCLTEIRVLEAA